MMSSFNYEESFRTYDEFEDGTFDWSYPDASDQDNDLVSFSVKTERSDPGWGLVNDGGTQEMEMT